MRPILAVFPSIFWAIKCQSLLITGTSQETRDCTYIEDIIDGLLQMEYFENAIGEEMNLAVGREIKILDLAEMINKKIGNVAGVRYLKQSPATGFRKIVKALRNPVAGEWFNIHTLKDSALLKSYLVL